MNVDTAKLRQFINEHFGPQDLNDLLFDYFRSVHEDLTPGMTKRQQISLLLEFCHQHNQMANLLAAVAQMRPFFQPDEYSQGEKAPTAAPQPPAPITRNPRQIFISHAHQDAEVAQRLAHDLEAHGYDIWIAPDSIRPGEKWAEAIDRGLDESGLFVVLLSPDAVASNWVRKETYAAIEFEDVGEMQLYPLMLKACFLPALWRSFQQISFSGQYDLSLQILLDELAGKRKKNGSPMPLPLWERLKMAMSQLLRKPIPLLAGMVVFSFAIWAIWLNFPVKGNPPEATKTVTPAPSNDSTSTPSITPTLLPTVPPQSDLIEIKRDDFSSIESDWDNYLGAKGVVQYDNREYSIEADSRVLFVGMWGGQERL